MLIGIYMFGMMEVQTKPNNISNNLIQIPKFTTVNLRLIMESHLQGIDV